MVDYNKIERWVRNELARCEGWSKKILTSDTRNWNDGKIFVLEKIIDMLEEKSVRNLRDCIEDIIWTDILQEDRDNFTLEFRTNVKGSIQKIINTVRAWDKEG